VRLEESGNKEYRVSQLLEGPFKGHRKDSIYWLELFSEVLGALKHRGD
jgi:hypothetical protein